MSQKAAIQKLFKIAKNQQNILKKLAQEMGQPATNINNAGGDQDVTVQLNDILNTVKKQFKLNDPRFVVQKARKTLSDGKVRMTVAVPKNYNTKMFNQFMHDAADQLGVDSAQMEVIKALG